VPILSLCVIARDEAANIQRCLRSAAGVADELVVVDTGSTDGTPELAAAEGARVHHFPWCDDFSAAYNHAFDHARGDWILYLDADEELTPEGRARLRPLLEDGAVLLYVLLREEMQHAGDPGPYVEMRVERLFRNHPRLRLLGRCHSRFPELGPLLREGAGRVADAPVRIRHHGFFAERLPEKLARAARHLEMELRDRPNQLYYEIELGRTWAALGDPRGQALLDRLVDDLRAAGWTPGPTSALVAALAEHALLTAPPADPRWEWAREAAERWFPRSPPLLYRLGEHHLRNEQYAEALPYWERLADLAESGDYDRAIPFGAAYLADGPFLFHAVCLHRLARFSAAERAYRRLLARHPGHPAATQNLALIPPPARRDQALAKKSGRRRR
jgi:glycosyltransferase involved in cell wall biosynthesis